ncbi:MAG: type II toxin-antitoxin system VapC family toxin [Chloroflexi bacterium]|mgnify:CR=1 FL=1|nr:type II toxin-antitoxin system VapC family toxin [Chloroflexota bacterium]
MKYLLDTNACIRYINGRSPKLRARLSSTPRQDVAVSTITKAEMFYGSAKSQTPQRSREKQIEFLTTLFTLPFDDMAAAAYGPLRADLEHKGTPIGQYDMLIAAVALANDLILVTHNVGEFGRIMGLKIEDWEA